MKRMTTIVAAMMVAAVLAAPAPAQLSGVYSVDNSIPTGGTNYNTLVEAATALATVGVSGPVVFIVNNTATPYAGFSIVSPITGSSATNTVTFFGVNLPVVSGVAAGFLQAIRLGAASVSTGTGPAYITIDGFDVTGAASGAGIIATFCSNIVVRNCKVHGCGSGIDFNACTTTTIEDNEVYGVGVTVGTPGSATYAGGITSYYNNHGCTIQRNKVHDCTNQGIFVGSSGSGTAPANNVVINNFVWNCPGAGTYPGGIAIRRSGGSIVSNNSVWMPAGSTVGGIHQMGGTGDPVPAQFSNNIVKHDGTGPCFRFETTTSPVPTILDYNLYDPAATASVGAVAATTYGTLAAWQAVTTPSLAGKEANTIIGPANFLSSTDLHITPGSLAFNSGSLVAAVTVDIDQQPRPLAGVPDRGADETPSSGLFAGFNATPTSGPANLTVVFNDVSFSSAPGGVLTWAWDFQNDGIDDAFVQNPTFTYTCPGTYSVKLTVTDSSNPAATLVRANMISVGIHRFDLSTTGGGVGDLTITPVPTGCGAAVGAVSGYTFATLTTTMPVGTGPIFGIIPDPLAFSIIFSAAAPGNPLHFIVAPPFYPDSGPIGFPAGTLSALSGLSMDGVMVFLNAAGGLVHYTNVDRVTF